MSLISPDEQRTYGSVDSGGTGPRSDLWYLRHEEILRRLSICWGTKAVRVAKKENDDRREYTEDVFEYA